MLITVSNLFPRPDLPTRGMFNAQLFRELSQVVGYQLSVIGGKAERQLSVSCSTNNQEPITGNHFLNICLVAEWRVWRWPQIRRWGGVGQISHQLSVISDQSSEIRPQTTDHRPQTSQIGATDSSDYRLLITDDRSPIADNSSHALPPTRYLPVFYLPLIGRSLNWWFCCRAIRRLARDIGHQRSDCRLQTSDIRPETQLPITDHRSPMTDYDHPSFKPEVCGLKSKVSFLASWLYPDGVATARVARELGAPVWLRVHGSDRFHLNTFWRRRLILDAVKCAQGVICNAAPVARDLVQCGVPAEKIHLVPNGVDSEVFKYRSPDHPAVAESVRIPTEQDKQPDVIPRNVATGTEICRTCSPVAESVRIPTAPCILFVANLVPIKGPDVMLRAFAALRQESDIRHQTSDIRQREKLRSPCSVAQYDAMQGKQVGATVLTDNRQPITDNPPFPLSPSPLASLCIIGSGPLRKQLERQARELGIADKVHFLGNRPHAEVALWMNRADVLCLTSRNEGMPNVVVEALASGLPVVATDVGACREMLEGEPAARICRSEDADGLAGALREVLVMKVDRKAMAEKYTHKYSWRKAAEMIAALMRADGIQPVSDHSGKGRAKSRPASGTSNSCHQPYHIPAS